MGLAHYVRFRCVKYTDRGNLGAAILDRAHGVAADCAFPPKPAGRATFEFMHIWSE